MSDEPPHRTFTFKKNWRPELQRVDSEKYDQLIKLVKEFGIPLLQRTLKEIDARNPL